MGRNQQVGLLLGLAILLMLLVAIDEGARYLSKVDMLRQWPE